MPSPEIPSIPLPSPLPHPHATPSRLSPCPPSNPPPSILDTRSYAWLLARGVSQRKDDEQRARDEALRLQNERRRAAEEERRRQEDELERALRMARAAGKAGRLEKARAARALELKAVAEDSQARLHMRSLGLLPALVSPRSGEWRKVHIEDESIREAKGWLGAGSPDGAGQQLSGQVEVLSELGWARSPSPLLEAGVSGGVSSGGGGGAAWLHPSAAEERIRLKHELVTAGVHPSHSRQILKRSGTSSDSGPQPDGRVDGHSFQQIQTSPRLAPIAAAMASLSLNLSHLDETAGSAGYGPSGYGSSRLGSPMIRPEVMSPISPSTAAEHLGGRISPIWNVGGNAGGVWNASGAGRISPGPSQRRLLARGAGFRASTSNGLDVWPSPPSTARGSARGTARGSSHGSFSARRAGGMGTSGGRTAQALQREFNWAPFVRAAETSEVIERVLGKSSPPTASTQQRRPYTTNGVGWFASGDVWGEAVREDRKQAARRLWY